MIFEGLDQIWTSFVIFDEFDLWIRYLIKVEFNDLIDGLYNVFAFVKNNYLFCLNCEYRNGFLLFGILYDWRISMSSICLYIDILSITSSQTV